jgi:oxygen-dependent protoporphyrinogen oxidase
VARKLGRTVVDTLVDPLIGGIHAGSVDDMSAAAVFPPLLAAAQRRGSLMRALGAEVPPAQPDGPPLFWSLEGGMAALVRALVSGLERRGADLRTSTPALRLERSAADWTVVAEGWTAQVDAVVLATPAWTTAALLRPHDDEAAALLDAIDYASVVVVTYRVRPEYVPAGAFGTGFLVPRRGRRADGDTWAVTACTYLDRKWPNLARDGEVLLRASLGRVDDTRAEAWTDAEVAERAWQELDELWGLSGRPEESIVSRYPRALPQYRVHHLLRAAGVEAAAARLSGMAVAGAAYRGVGIPACVASGRAAAHTLL